jgi:integrin alpha FG-GAP repeat containing protein 1
MKITTTCWHPFRASESSAASITCLLIHILPIIVVVSIHVVPGAHAVASFSTQPVQKRIDYQDSGILAAFADINADTKTDVFLIDKDLKSFTIMMHHKDNGNFESSILYFSQRCYMNEEIVSLIPSDFRGDTYVDVAVISRNPNPGETYNIRIARGNGPNKELDCSNLNRTANYSSSVQPLLLDYNGDMIADLLIENTTEAKRWILIGPYNKEFNFAEIRPFGEKGHPITDPHSNQFVDFNGDNVADIVIETKKFFEYWYADSNGHYGESTADGTRAPSKRVPRPNKIDGHQIDPDHGYGLSVFMDIDGDARQEHLLPVNLKYDGEVRAAILMHRENGFAFELIAGNFTPSNETQYLKFWETKYQSPHARHDLIFPIAIRAGDVNGDGYPDLVSLMQPKDKSTSNIIVLQNVPDAKGKDGDRTFVFMSKVDRRPFEDPLIAAFMDLTENGKLDLMYSSRLQPVGGSEVLNFGALENVVAFENYFLKVMVASGNCPPTGCTQDGWAFDKKEVVDYGSNIPGAYMTYSLQDVNGKTKRSGVGQMSSSAHFSLQTPYQVMGLGEYANYVDLVTATIPYAHDHHREKRTREEEQIVPDAQIVVVPRDQDPRKWTVKMWLNITGNQIKHTGFTLLAIFCVLIVIILALHKKEVMEDADENKRFKQNWLDRR